MPAPPLTNTFETGLADTTAITIANSDDGSAGNAFNTVSGSSPAFSTTHAKSGSLAMRYDTTATYAQGYVDWQTLGSITGSVWFRFYLYSTAHPVTTAMRMVLFRTSAANCGLLFYNPTGFLQGGNAAQAGGTAGTVAPALNQWVRIEVRILPSATVGEVEWWLYNTPEAVIGDFDDHVLITSQVLAANVDQVRLGGTTAVGPNSLVAWFDDMAVSSSGQIGPSGAAGQTLYPDADLATGGWATTPLWSKVDETSADGTVISDTSS